MPILYIKYRIGTNILIMNKNEHLEREKYIKIWSSYKNVDKVFFFNPQNKGYYIGIDAEISPDAAFHFFPLEFFKTYESSDIEELKKEGIAFKKAIISKEGNIVYNNICDLKNRINNNIVKKRHSYIVKDNDYEQWVNYFSKIKKEIECSRVKKVVASRQVQIECNTPIDVESLLLRLLENNEDSYIFAYKKGEKIFIGASPEILVQRKKDSVISYAIAGTIEKNESQNRKQGEKLLDDIKNNYEHQLVVDYIASNMEEMSEKVIVGETKLLELKNLFHLKTPIIAEDNKKNLLEWVKLLHPTPAMGGIPRQVAIDLIKEYEEYERKLYAAPIGIIENSGEGIFVVGIRSALIDGNKVYAYAGCGIVEQSNCREEYEETNTKLRTILEAL